MLLAGYLKALERRKSVPRPKGFCEADNVNVFDAVSPNPKSCDLRVTDTSMFYENMIFFSICGKL